MTNNIEIVVEGKNEATKVFQNIEQSARKSASDTEQSWAKAMDGVDKAVKSTGNSANGASQSLVRFSDSSASSARGVRDLGDSTRDGDEKLRRLGETSDEVDTKAMGFRDTITGVQDTMKGLSDASLSTGDRLLTLGMGIGDLGSAGYNLLAPAMIKVKQVISDVREPTSDLRGKLNGLGKSMVGMAAGAAIIAGLGAALEAAFGEKPANVNALTYSLRDFIATGKVSGEAARVFSGNLDDLKQSFYTATAGGVVKFIEGLYDLIPGADLVGVSMSEAKNNITSLDQSLAQMAQTSPQAASQAFYKLASDMHLSTDETNKLKDQLPAYTTAMRQAADATGQSAESQARNAEALQSYLTQLTAATDPVFNLLNSLNGVTEAQNAYNEAVATGGANSTEAKDAAVALAEAVAQAEAAALNGQLSYTDFSGALDHWVASGVVTAQQAASIRDRVNEARGSAQAYTGNYNASLFMENRASSIIAQVKRDLDSVPDSTYKKFVMTYVQQVIGNAPVGNPPGYGFIGNRAQGGPIGHAAEGGGRTGLTWVGEHGPELLKLPAGAFVNPAGASSRAAAMGGGGGGNATVTLEVVSGGAKMDDFLVEILRKAVRARGGNVQIVLGKKG